MWRLAALTALSIIRFSVSISDGTLLRGVSWASPAVSQLQVWSVQEFVDHQQPYSTGVSQHLLEENARYAIKARDLTANTNEVTDELFLSDVLPMRQLDEPVESWRPTFYNKLVHLAQDKTTLKDVADAVVPAVFAGDLGNPVDFKAQQTPGIMAPLSETLQHGYASCSGLSILVTDALRSVGVPARVVGTAEWNIPTGGNHNWVEVWWGGRWHFIDATPPGDAVSWDATWFIGNAAKGVPGTIHGIYTALSVGRGNGTYSYTWRDPFVNATAEDRTPFYKSLVEVETDDPRADEYRHGSEDR